MNQHLRYRLRQKFNIKVSRTDAPRFINNLLSTQGFIEYGGKAHNENRKLYHITISKINAVVVYDHLKNCPVTVWPL